MSKKNPTKTAKKQPTSIRCWKQKKPVTKVYSSGVQVNTKFRQNILLVYIFETPSTSLNEEQYIENIFEQ